MAAPTFTNSGSDPLYLLTYSSTVASCAYWPNATATSPITQADAWSGVGVFLFFGEAVSDQATFVDGLQSYLQQAGNIGIRFVWIENPNADWLQWKAAHLTVQNNATSGISVLDLGGYALRIGNPLTIDIASDYSSVSYTHLTLPTTSRV